MFMHSVSSKFYSKSSSLIIQHKSFEHRRPWLSFLRLNFKPLSLGFRFEAHFPCFMNSVSSKIYSKSSSLIIQHKSFEKHRPWLSFLSLNFKPLSLGFRFEAHFPCFMNSVSSKIYTKSSSLIIQHKSFEKRRPWLSFFSAYFKRHSLVFLN